MRGGRALPIAVAAVAMLGCGGGGAGTLPERPPGGGFDAGAAFDLLEYQVELGPRPAGSEASRELAELLRAELPNGRFQEVPGGLRNVVGQVEGRDPDRIVVVGAHYDTKDIEGFVGANDGAAGTAVVTELARSTEPGELGPTVVFILFDGEEAPAGVPDERFVEEGLRGSRVAAAEYGDAEAMILLDFVGDRDLSIPREANSDERLWERLREAAGRAGHEAHFPDEDAPPVADDHLPFRDAGVPSIDLIDFGFACFHRACDDLSAVSENSLEAAGETVQELLRRL